MSSDSLIAPIETSEAVLAEFRKGFRAHAVQAAIRQDKINAYSARLENSSKLMDGIGQLKYRVDADLHAHMKALFGPDCWKDPSFTDLLEREGVIVRVKGISDKIMSFAPAKQEQGEKVQGKRSEVSEETANAIISQHTFADNELPAPNTCGVVDGTEAVAA